MSTPNRFSIIHNGRVCLRQIGMLSLLAATLTLVAACEKNLSDANLKHVRSDMSTKEVESILGHPTRIESSPEVKREETVALPVTRYVYEQNGRKVELTFVGDKLASGGIAGSFEP